MEKKKNFILLILFDNEFSIHMIFYFIFNSKIKRHRNISKIGNLQNQKLPHLVDWFWIIKWSKQQENKEKKGLVSKENQLVKKYK